jgi:hypothetical protein
MFINETKYWHVTGKISISLNKLVVSDNLVYLQCFVNETRALDLDRQCCEQFCPQHWLQIKSNQEM